MTRSSLSLTLLLAGGVVSMPVVMVGHILAESYGSVLALVAIVAGNGILCVIAFLNAHLALKFRATTSDTVGHLGGKALSKAFGVAMIVSMLGWFVVQCSVLVEFSQGYFPGLPHGLLALIIGASLIATAMGDIKRLFWLSEKMGPVVLLAMVAMLFWSAGDAQITPPVLGATAFFPAISLVLATSLGVVIDVPTYYRFVLSRRNAWLSLFVVTWLVTSMVQVLGVILVGQYALSELIASPFGVVLAMSGWLMNVNNLYSAVVSSQTLVRRGSFAMRAIGLGALGIAVVCFQAGHSIATSIEAITLGISSMGGVMLACVLLRSQTSYGLAFAWITGALFGGLSLNRNIFLTGAAQVDAFLIAGVAAGVFLLGVKIWQLQLSMNNS